VNSARVIERVIKPRRLADIRHDPWLQAAASWFVRSTAIEANWAMLDFAGKVCRSRNPLCKDCPVARTCSYFKNSRA
jgi:A/G-specific adenine glycosylase